MCEQNCLDHAGEDLPEYLSILLKAGASIECRDSDGYTPLTLHLRSENVDMAWQRTCEPFTTEIDMLIKAGCDVNEACFERTQTGVVTKPALIMAVSNDLSMIVHLLMQAGADPNIRGKNIDS